jgi:competence transcription factor ComK
MNEIYIKRIKVPNIQLNFQLKKLIKQFNNILGEIYAGKKNNTLLRL